MAEKRLKVSASPHIFARQNLKFVMYAVILALMPALFGSIYFYGLRALYLVILSVAAAVVAEAVCQWAYKRPITITDGSAIITGILLAYNLPPGVPYWMPVVGSVFAIVVAKQFFGGLGYNFINPALAGRAFLMASWPVAMTHDWLPPAGGTISGLDGITRATPLNLIKAADVDPSVIERLTSLEGIRALFFGNVGGCLGETSALLLLIGGIALLILKIIDYRITLSYLLTVVVLSLILPIKGHPPYNILFQLFSGGLFLGAFFMATDMVTTPVTKRGRWIFGIGCGIFTMLIRTFGGYPEGVSYSILFMNVWTPFIDRYTMGRRFGTR
ncbi:Na+-transporting NADH:ubiquinone oxidoreductase subunit D [candidate division WOR-3 bacterium]|uniref:Ion-translocating oxidoreductase complex subunit D n=1 Tax=candidate division WOR-3 bacterium TaxID=2052148 RepID=A0A660SIS2_UNCW3|nr:MAG: Na+-transporting NADH:ubiquinone oxidoreductase subunit D [candidate division WOR-3 bacterium]